jgi:hypothetical protein
MHPGPWPFPIDGGRLDGCKTGRITLVCLAPHNATVRFFTLASVGAGIGSQMSIRLVLGLKADLAQGEVLDDK